MLACCHLMPPPLQLRLRSQQISAALPQCVEEPPGLPRMACQREDWTGARPVLLPHQDRGPTRRIFTTFLLRLRPSADVLPALTSSFSSFPSPDAFSHFPFPSPPTSAAYFPPSSAPGGLRRQASFSAAVPCISHMSAAAMLLRFGSFRFLSIPISPIMKSRE